MAPSLEVAAVEVAEESGRSGSITSPRKHRTHRFGKVYLDARGRDRSTGVAAGNRSGSELEQSLCRDGHS
jgi:hypothetical protein